MHVVQAKPRWHLRAIPHPSEMVTLPFASSPLSAMTSSNPDDLSLPSSARGTLVAAVENFSYVPKQAPVPTILGVFGVLVVLTVFGAGIYSIFHLAH